MTHLFNYSTMYPPKHYQENNFENIVKVIKKYPLATLISVDKEDCIITHLPLIYKTEENDFGKLLGHIDKNNPQSSLLDNRKIQVIFSTPDTYISPNDYSTEQLPTWNYIKVHLRGKVKAINDPEKTKDILIQTTEYLETSEKPFILSPKHEKMNQLLKFIVGFEIEILEWEGKFKLSQDKTAQDTELTKQKLIKTAQENIEDFINDIFEGHQNKVC